MVSRDENPHMAPRAESRAEWRRLGVGFTAFVAVLVGLLIAIGVGARVAGGAISDAICGSYNFISNDFCDEWNYETPPADALPVPPSWEIEWRMLDCGSGGCGSRLYVLSPGARTGGGVATYLREIRSLGWRVGSKAEARRDDLLLDVEPATDRILARLIPRRLQRPEYVFVSLAICGEGAVCN
jgi:hypothetical protein